MIISYLFKLNISNSITKVTTEHCGTRDFEWGGNSPGAGASGVASIGPTEPVPTTEKRFGNYILAPAVPIRAIGEKFLKFVPFSCIFKVIFRFPSSPSEVSITPHRHHLYRRA